jgi:hypothetical protein
VNVGHEQHEPVFGQGNGLKNVADAGGVGVLAVDEDGYVGAQRAGDVDELVAAQTGLPEFVEPEQHGGGVGAATAQAGPHGDVLGEGDAGTERAAGGGLQGTGRAQGEVVGLADAFGVVRAADGAGGGDGQRDVVLEVDELEDGFEQVQAVFTAAGDVQEQVELGGRGQGQRGRYRIRSGCRWRGG